MCCLSERIILKTQLNWLVHLSMLKNCLAKCCVHLFINLFLYLFVVGLWKELSHICDVEKLHSFTNTHTERKYYQKVLCCMGFHDKRHASQNCLLSNMSFDAFSTHAVDNRIHCRPSIAAQITQTIHTQKKHTKMPPLQLVSWALVHICRNLHKNAPHTSIYRECLISYPVSARNLNRLYMILPSFTHHTTQRLNIANTIC